MYLPPHFEPSDPALAIELIARVQIGELVTSDGSEISASTIPMLFDGSRGDGALLGHVARANPQWSTYSSGIEALAIFRGPDAYISPSWYATKAEHGRVVPTWNYATVHVHGRLVVHDDAEWKRQLVTRLTESRESGRPSPWEVADAPEAYVTSQLRAIVGLELVVTRLEAKWKLSQNQPLANRQGVVEGLEHESAPGATGVAAMMQALPGMSG